MLPEWKTFLERAGALVENGSVSHFSKPDEELQALAGQTIICDLSHLGLIAATGPDAQAFLQGQFSNDVREVTEQSSQLNAYCSPKGRVLALFRLFKWADTYYLSLPHEILEATLKRLRMFVLRSQVMLAKASDNLVAIGLSGPDAEVKLANILGDLPQGIDNSLQINYAGDRLTCIRIPGQQPRFIIYGDLNAVKALWTEFADHVTSVGINAWKLLDIRSGIPVIYPATVDAFVPQMINLQDINAVSFKKGCYPGQEIVARMQYLGTLKRRMYQLQVDSSVQPLPGDDLYINESDQSVGQIVDAQPAPQGGFELLAVLQIANTAEGKVRLHSRQGSLIQFINQGQE